MRAERPGNLRAERPSEKSTRTSLAYLVDGPYNGWRPVEHPYVKSQWRVAFVHICEALASFMEDELGHFAIPLPEIDGEAWWCDLGTLRVLAEMTSHYPVDDLDFRAVPSWPQWYWLWHLADDLEREGYHLAILHFVEPSRVDLPNVPF